MSESRSITIHNEGDVINARLQTRQMAKDAGLQILDQARISLAVSSLANVIHLGAKHQGQIVINRITDGERSGIQVIWMLFPSENTVDIIQSLDTTAWSLMVDDVEVDTSNVNGICITAVKWAAQRSPAQAW